MRRLFRWLDSYTLLVLNPARIQPARQTHPVLPRG
jgi:hypothetical protein